MNILSKIRDAAKKAGSFAKKAGKETANAAKKAGSWVADSTDKAANAVSKAREIYADRREEKEKFRSEQREQKSFKKAIEKTEEIKKNVAQMDADLNEVKDSIELILTDSKGFKLFVAEEFKSVRDDIDKLEKKIETEAASQKKKFIIQSIAFGAGIVVAIIIALLK